MAGKRKRGKRPESHDFLWLLTAKCQKPSAWTSFPYSSAISKYLHMEVRIYTRDFSVALMRQAAAAGHWWKMIPFQQSQGAPANP